MNELKESIQLLQASEEIRESNLVFGTWGNLSMRIENRILITPSGIPYEYLREEDLVLCDMEGKILEGKKIPSSELKMHVALYGAREDIKAVVHTHSLYASVASTIFEEIPLLTEDTAMTIGGTVKVTKYRTPGTRELAEETVKSLGRRNAAILANHGQIGVGPTLDDAILASIMCEKSCQMYLMAANTGKIPHTLSDEEISKLHEKYVTSYRKLRDFTR